MAVPTEQLADQIRETNQRLTEAIHQVVAKLDNFRVEVAKDFGQININLERYQAETATSLRFLGRGVLVLIPIVVALIGAAIGGAWYLAKLDSRVERVESRLGGESPAIPRGALK